MGDLLPTRPTNQMGVTWLQEMDAWKYPRLVPQVGRGTRQSRSRGLNHLYLSRQITLPLQHPNSMWHSQWSRRSQRHPHLQSPRRFSYFLWWRWLINYTYRVARCVATQRAISTNNLCEIDDSDMEGSFPDTSVRRVPLLCNGALPTLKYLP